MNTWLRIYLQLASYYKQEEQSEFLVPVFSGNELVQVALVSIFGDRRLEIFLFSSVQIISSSIVA